MRRSAIPFFPRKTPQRIGREKLFNAGEICIEHSVMKRIGGGSLLLVFYICDQPKNSVFTQTRKFSGSLLLSVLQKRKKKRKLKLFVGFLVHPTDLFHGRGVENERRMPYRQKGNTGRGSSSFILSFLDRKAPGCLHMQRPHVQHHSIPPADFYRDSPPGPGLSNYLLDGSNLGLGCRYRERVPHRWCQHQPRRYHVVPDCLL